MLLSLQHYTTKASLLLVMLSLSVGCQQKTSVEQAPETYILDDVYLEKCRTLDAIPVPMEAAARLRNLNPSFYADLLLPSGQEDYMRTGPQQALALGAYSADLAYIQLYKRPLQAHKHVQSVEALAKALNVQEAIGLRTMVQDLQQTSTPDSALNRLNLGFSRLCVHLQMRGQLPLSVLAVAGGWFEGMHLLFGAGEKVKNEKDYHALASSQKVILDYLVSATPTGANHSEEEEKMYSFIREAHAILHTPKLDSTQRNEEESQGAWVEENGISVFKEAPTKEKIMSSHDYKRLSAVVAQARSLILQGGIATAQAGL